MTPNLKLPYNMKRLYSRPELIICEAQSVQMLAASLAINDTVVDGADALVKEDNDWDIWNNEE